MVSPVWLKINSKDPLRIATHDIQKLWIHDMKAADNENSTVKSTVFVINEIYLIKIYI